MMSSRPGRSSNGLPHMLLVADLWPSNPGPSEVRVSKYEDDGFPYFVCKISGDYKAVIQAMDVLRAGYAAAGVKYNVTEKVH